MVRDRRRSGPRPMTDEEIDAYLDARDEWAMLTTIGRDGLPHTVPLGYFRVGRDVVLGMRDGTQKVVNAERNPSVCVLVSSSKLKGRDVRGVMIQGRATVQRDRAQRLELAREAARQRGDDPPTEVSDGGVYLTVQRQRVISWVYD